MAVQSDISVGWKKETTYGTAVTVDRWAPVTAETLVYATEWNQGTGLIVGSGGVPLASRYYPTIKQGSGDFTVELNSKGLGTLLELAMGTATSTVVSGSAYQQLFTLGTQASATIQRGLVFGDATGTRDQQTFKGCVCTGFEITVPQAEQATLTTMWDIRDYDTSTAYATPSYPSYVQAGMMHWGQAALVTGGTFTAPTTTTMASIAGGTDGTNVRSWSMKLERTIDTERFNMDGSGGLKQIPLSGTIDISGTMEVEHTDAAFRTAAIAGTVLPLTLTLTTEEDLGTGTSQFQVGLPGVVVTGFPVSNEGSLPVTSYEFSGKFATGAAQPLYLALRTADTAL
jgi:Phage tail tube protein